jgi:hypothetical protein
MTLRESLNQSIIQLTNAADYWSEQTLRGKAGGHHYIKIVKTIEELKTYIIESERNDREELRLSSRSDGGLYTETYDWVENALREQAESDGNQYVRSDS